MDITTSQGSRYQGQLRSVGEQDEGFIVLKNARQLASGNPSTENGEHVSPEMNIQLKDITEAQGTKSGTSSSISRNHTKASQKNSAWKTDTDISGQAPVRERVLQAWQPPPDEEGFGIEDNTSISDKNESSSKKWDQFAANEKLFGVKSQWDEDMYTHKLDTSKPDFARRKIEAERLAREIEQSASTNTHIMEERGQAIDDSGLTEEDKYSGVQRSANAWVPPARRAPAIANLPAPRESPIDPAIISSQLAKPGTSGHRSIHSVVTTPRASTGQAQPLKEAPGTGSRTVTPIESDIMTRFKQFATNERDRLSVKKAATFKKEKDGRLQDLLAFSKDFKLNTPVPADLIPILAKDKAKQEAIVQRAASTSNSPASSHPASTVVSEESTFPSTPESLRSRVEKARQSPAQITPKPFKKAPQAEAKKLKPSAAEFKPFNPAASSFTPAQSQNPATISSPALSTTSSQPRQSNFSADASSFFPKKPKPLAERTPILEQYDPFKTYAEKHPDASTDIETPLKVDPSWPSENSNSITDPPGDSRRSHQEEEQYSSPLQSFVPGPPSQMLFVGSPQQAHGFQPQGYYKQSQQYMSAPPGQYVQYQGGAAYVTPQYMYQSVPGYGVRAMQTIPGYLPQQYGYPVPQCKN